jgi:class 3 adenylate cyclase
LGPTGLHTGEVELHGDAEPRANAIHIGARIAALAEAGEVLVSATTRDLVAGWDSHSKTAADTNSRESSRNAASLPLSADDRAVGEIVDVSAEGSGLQAH